MKDTPKRRFWKVYCLFCGEFIEAHWGAWLRLAAVCRTCAAQGVERCTT